MRLNTVDTYRELQPFQSVEELNASLSAMRSSEAFRAFTPTARRVFDVLARYSCRYPGVSFRSKAKIADELGVSRRTVIRAVQQMERAGFVKQSALMRHNGDRRQAASAIVFIAQATSVTPESHAIETELQAQDIKHTKETEKPKQAIIKDGLAAHLPEVLRNCLAPFYNDADALYRAVGVVYRAKASVSADLRIEAHEDAFRQAIAGVMSAYKRGKVRSLDAVLYAAIRNLTKSLYIRGLFADALAR